MIVISRIKRYNQATLNQFYHFTFDKYDDLVADLQHEMHTRQNSGANSRKISAKLRRIRQKRERVAQEYDHVLVRQLLDYIIELSERYTLYVSIGQLMYIRNVAHRGNYRGRPFRRMIHSWAFARITQNLEYKLSQLGWKTRGKDSRFRVVPESWTSIICWKCGSKGTRPKQNYFHCPSCGHKTNADRNGSINIAARLITLTKSLHNVRGLGKWADAVLRAGKRSQLKAQQKKPSSKGKSLLSSKGQVSDLGESAAVHHAQSSLLDFTDEVQKGDNDPAVEKDAETLTVAGEDTTRVQQEKEARTIGGIPSR
jgi:transposase